MARSTNFTLGCILGVVLALGLVVCGGGGALVLFGLHLYEEEVCAYLGEQPAVVEALGELRACEVSFGESADITDPDTFVFHLEGALGEGSAYVQSTSTGEGGAEVYQGILLEAAGERILVQGRAPPTR